MYHLKSASKDFAINILYWSGIIASRLNKRTRNSALILAYHRVNTESYIQKHPIMPGMYVSNKTLRMHIAWLRDHYKMTRLSEVIREIKNQKEFNEPICAITFDDGWQDNYEFAFPILKELRIPATIFLVGDRIGGSGPNSFDMCFELIQNMKNPPRYLTGVKEIDDIIAYDVCDRIEKARRAIHQMRQLPIDQFKYASIRLRHHISQLVNFENIYNKYAMLGWNQLKEMQQTDMEFGYHSRNHYILTRIHRDQIQNEISPPLDEAIAHGVEIKKIFCFPDGQYNSAILGCLKEFGYEGAVSLKPGFNDIHTDPYSLYRFNIHEGGASRLAHFLSSIAFS